MTAQVSTDVPATAAQVWATRVAFLVLGIAMAAWAPLIPFVKAQLGASDAFFGLLLLCIGIGAIIAMPLCGVLASKFGCRPVIVAGTLAMCIALVGLIGISNVWLILPALFLFGVGIAAVDIAMNIQAVVIEQRSGRTIMSGFHGCYSLGGMLGAGLVSALLWITGAPMFSLLIAIAVVVLVSALSFKHLLNEPSTRDSSKFVFPKGIVLLLGIMCFIIFMAEGAVLDWSALFLRDFRAVDAAQAGLGYVFFSFTMMLGRFTGDAVVMRLGSKRIVLLGGLLGAIGFAMVVLLPEYWMGYLGFALVGLGCANIVPVLFTATGRQHIMPVNAAITSVAGIGYLGGLIGPAFVGFISQLSNLSVAFIVIASGLFIVGLLSKKVN